jgi:hypothetical protein
MNPAQVNDTARAMMGAIKRSYDTVPPFATAQANYLATGIYSGVGGSNGFSALGSTETPDNTRNASAIFQKITTGIASGTLTNPAIYASSTKTSSTFD